MNIVDIDGFESYSVSDTGIVFTSTRFNGELRQSTDTNGYKLVKLYKNNKQHTRRVHRLVAEAFIENIENKPQVNHRNGKKDENHYSNLEWATREENIQHAHDNGLMKNVKETISKMNHIRISISKETAQAIRDEWKQNGTGQIRLARMFGTNKSTAYRASRNKIKIYDLE